MTCSLTVMNSWFSSGPMAWVWDESATGEQQWRPQTTGLQQAKPDENSTYHRRAGRPTSRSQRPDVNHSRKGCTRSDIRAKEQRNPRKCYEKSGTNIKTIYNPWQVMNKMTLRLTLLQLNQFIKIMEHITNDWQPRRCSLSKVLFVAMLEGFFFTCHDFWTRSLKNQIWNGDWPNTTF